MDAKKNYSFGERMRALRGSQTQTVFAKKCEVTQGMIARYEKGIVPERDILLRISKNISRSIDWLLTGNDFEYIGGDKELDCPWTLVGGKFVFQEGTKRAETGGDGLTLDDLDKRILAQVQGLTPDQKRTVEDLISDYKLVQELKQERAGKKAA
jgi:transcriptional regulator with XRE-family HTH domain